MKKASVVVMALVLGLLLVAGVSPGNVNANECDLALWIHPNCTVAESRKTIYTVDNAELRVGYYRTVYYAWGRFTTSEPGATVWLDIDTNGDGHWDEHSKIDNDGYTWAHVTNASAPRVEAMRISIRHANNTWSFGPWWSQDGGW
ncbi:MULTISPECIES: hypothetical protein [Paenibacillus]|uniref:Uncharacterized protein n=1 Tax=Paenibacillus lautus TaxID=1401 RepID=A0A1R1B104_PAELA|nr:hypothetical protein [Paenibacillus lautus]OME92228.1 hypothetical protein BK123_16605 [Paenibacillus lautus]